MLSTCVQESYNFLDKNICKILKEKEAITLEETEQEGKVSLYVTVSNDAIVIIKADNKVFPYISNGQYFQKCCDKILFTFEKKESDECILHVIEFTKSINIQKLVEKVRPQLKMGIMNAKAIAGFLSIDIKDIKAYVGYRTFKKMDSSTEMRYLNTRYGAIAMHDWKTHHLTLDMPWGKSVYANNNIQLDEEGNGSLII